MEILNMKKNYFHAGKFTKSNLISGYLKCIHYIIILLQ